MNQPVTVFISYTHEDELLREQLVRHLRPLQCVICLNTRPLA